MALLSKVREAMKPGASLVLLEELILETPEPAPGKWICSCWRSPAAVNERKRNIVNCSQPLASD
jgi:hypothetical protein